MKFELSNGSVELIIPSTFDGLKVLVHVKKPNWFSGFKLCMNPYRTVCQRKVLWHSCLAVLWIYCCGRVLRPHLPPPTTLRDSLDFHHLLSPSFHDCRTDWVGIACFASPSRLRTAACGACLRRSEIGHRVRCWAFGWHEQCADVARRCIGWGCFPRCQFAS